MNLFRYCAGDSVNRTDPKGLQFEDFHKDDHLYRDLALEMLRQLWNYYHRTPQPTPPPEIYGPYQPAPTVHADGHEYDANGMRISFLTASVSEVTPVLHWDFAQGRYVGDPGTYRATDPTVAQAAIERAMAYGNAQNPPTDRPLALPDERGWFTTHGGTGVIGYLGNEPTPGGSGYAMMMSNGIARWTPQQQIAALQHAFHAPQFYPGGASYKAIMERRPLGR